MLQKTVLQNVQNFWKQILIVTKYWDNETTQKILMQAQKEYSDILFWIWENRIEVIKTKNIPRDLTHFIGNIQSQKIWEIVQYCWTIHSLSSLKHALKIENFWFPISAFVQINLDPNKNIWISQDTLEYFLKVCSSFKNLKIIWISGMWSADTSEEKKWAEFQSLIALRDTHLPNWLISAGTSRDYEIALKEWINIVRVWSAAITTEA